MNTAFPLTNRQPGFLQNHFTISCLHQFAEQLNNSPKLHAANRYEVLYLQSGSGKLCVNLYENLLDSQHAYFIIPGQLRSITLDKGAVGFYVSVSADFMNATDTSFLFGTMLEQCKGLGNAITIAIDHRREEMDSILQKMENEVMNEHPLQTEMLQVFFKTFLLYLLKNNSFTGTEHTPSNDRRIVKMFMQLVHQHFTQKKMVAEYADELCVSRNYLNKVVKKVSGFTASEIIQQSIIQEAKKQAIQSGNSMKQIAYNLGFESSAHFSKFFKNNSGLNFTSYKRELGVFQLTS